MSRGSMQKISPRGSAPNPAGAVDPDPTMPLMFTKHPKMPGIGRGNHPNSQDAWKLGCKQKVLEGPRDPTLPTTVPMPSAVEDITDAGMRAMWEQSMALDGEAASCMEPLD